MILNYRWTPVLPPGSNYFINLTQIPGIPFIITPREKYPEGIVGDNEGFFYLKIYTYINDEEIFNKRFKCELYKTHR